MPIDRVETGGHNPEATTKAGSRIRAAEYVRMSTDHQRYSIDNQSNAIRSYADRRGMEIVRTYTDAGRSGLNISGRTGLQQLLTDVRSGAADYSVILVYDISRWGRFQDSDEPAAYEYACRVMGVRVAYCAEQFENDGSIGSDIQKVVKRRMAAEFSRELSVKVFRGQARLIELGYRQGGQPGLGLRRQLFDETGAAKGELAFKQKKSIQTDRVVLVLGPAKERAIVRSIYNDFVNRGLNEGEIAARLNERGVLNGSGRAWERGAVHNILTNEKYIGNNVWNRGSSKLRQRRVRNTPDLWIRAEGAFPAIVEQSLFDTAQDMIRARSYRMTDDELLQALRNILRSRGCLSESVINAAPQGPSGGAYRRRFGSLLRAYQLIGYSRDGGYLAVTRKRFLRRFRPNVVAQVIEGIERVGGKVTPRGSDLLLVNGELSVSIKVVRCRMYPGGSMRWMIRLDRSLRSDVTIAVRMNHLNSAARDYLILPTANMDSDVVRVAEYNGIALDGYRFDSLDPFFEMVGRVHLKDAA